MNFLAVSKDYAEFTDPDRAAEYDAPISTIQSLMSVLTFGLLLSFAGVGIKKAYVAARSTSLSDIRARARSFKRSRGGSATPSEAPRLEGVSNDEESFGDSNPMRSSAGANAASKRTSSKAAGRDLAVEMTSFRSSKATELAQRGRQLSVESSETMALPAPAPAVAAHTPATSELPARWAAHTTPTGDNYYYNATTGVTSWTLPEAE